MKEKLFFAGIATLLVGANPDIGLSSSTEKGKANLCHQVIAGHPKMTWIGVDATSKLPLPKAQWRAPKYTDFRLTSSGTIDSAHFAGGFGVYTIATGFAKGDKLWFTTTCRKRGHGNWAVLDGTATCRDGIAEGHFYYKACKKGGDPGPADHFYFKVRP